MKKFWLPLVFLLLGVFTHAQTVKNRIAVFIPLEIDDMVSPASPSKVKNLNKQHVQFLDFYQGVRKAADSLASSFIAANIDIYDLKSSSISLDSIFNTEQMAQTCLVLSPCKEETAQLATLANKLGIPFISLSQPNDAGVKQNPNFFINNTTLKNHVKGIYGHLQKKYAVDNVLLAYTADKKDSRMVEYYEEAETNTNGVKLGWKKVLAERTNPLKAIMTLLDSNRTNVIVCASLTDSLGFNLLKLAGSKQVIKKYKILVMGLPFWEGYNLNKKKEYTDVQYAYSSPTYLYQTNKLFKSLEANFEANYGYNPSDNYFKAYNALLQYGRIALKYPETFAAHINDRDFEVFYQAQFLPQIGDKKTMALDYFENIKLKFVYKRNGEVINVLD
jgi:hypothetical protein